MVNVNNEIIAKKLDNANFCLAVLEAKGATVTSIEIKNRKPVVTIKTYLVEPFELKGFVKKSFQENGRNWETYSAELEECQVEWTIPAQRKTA
ncbi:hypothetical protein [Methylophaga nitratireducenticrescens]|uniref:hypothetical protein n=1 Tax=Methylophaga nitratireducenticrescens TaxID=754476 RepID=UPI000CDC97CE|nr:hypothetical protein [Methylophaga nitratireducenticrescens]AUZ85808.1 hypothetical protein CDW43_15095 [Methylophaga nitratireducenticrescens]AUZ85876.1 hypothetical protein CDW43_15450 [Methylophaga nitratireducenticrescens]